MEAIIANILSLIGTLLVIMYGASFLTDGAASIARKMRVSPLVVGLTILSIGTSTPELAVSLSAAAAGSTNMAIGNIVGSNTMNILLILGITAMIAPIAVAKSTAKVEIPFLLVLSLIFFLQAKPSIWGSDPSLDVIERREGLMLLLLFLMFWVYVFRLARKSKPDLVEDLDDSIPVYSWGLSIALIIVGLIMLSIGGKVFTRNASFIASMLHVSEAVIGVTIVAFGTSIPELATTLVAARKGQVDMAVGNVVGSNIFNIMLIGGTVSTIMPQHTQQLTTFDFIVMIVAVVLLLLSTLFLRRRVIDRAEGFVMLMVYIAYTVLLVLNVTGVMPPLLP